MTAARAITMREAPLGILPVLLAADERISSLTEGD